MPLVPTSLGNLGLEWRPAQGCGQSNVLMLRLQCMYLFQPPPGAADATHGQWRVLDNIGLDALLSLKLVWLINKLSHAAPGRIRLESLEINSNFRNFIPGFPLLIDGRGQLSAFISLFLHDNFIPRPIASPWLLVRATLGFPKFESLRKEFRDLVLLFDMGSLGKLVHSLFKIP